jgi:hypothetical protein
MGEEHMTMSDLTGENFFDWDDIKPGDWGEATISIHVFDNDAWGWVHFLNVFNHDNGLTEPESEVDTTGGDDEGELAQHIFTFLWLDEGMIPGWQNSDTDPTNDDPYEGNNIYDCWDDPLTGEKICEEIIYGTPYVEDAKMADMIDIDCCWLGPWYIANCKTIYIGWYWWVPTWVENIIQSDSFGFDVEFQVDQFRNNPMPIAPGTPCE